MDDSSFGAGGTGRFTINGTKKGNLPLFVEKRKYNKVTVIRNIRGDVSSLLTAVKQALGSGGTIERDAAGAAEIVVQGDHSARLEKFLLLKKHDSLRGVKKKTVEKAQKTATKQQQKKQKGKSKSIKRLDAKRAAPTSKAAAAVRAGGVALSVREVKALKPKDLKAHLQARDLSTQGNKKDLAARLTAALAAEASAAAAAAAAAEDAATAAAAAAEWTQAEQQALEAAIKATNGMPKADRWAAIADRVAGRSEAECKERFKWLRARMAAAAEEARRRDESAGGATPPQPPSYVAAAARTR